MIHVCPCFFGRLQRSSKHNITTFRRSMNMNEHDQPLTLTRHLFSSLLFLVFYNHITPPNTIRGLTATMVARWFLNRQIQVRQHAFGDLLSDLDTGYARVEFTTLDWTISISSTFGLCIIAYHCKVTSSRCLEVCKCKLIFAKSSLHIFHRYVQTAATTIQSTSYNLA